jgi:hypothetical protein
MRPAGAAGAHDGRDAALGRVPGDLVQQVHVLLLPLPAGAALLLDDRVREAGELQPAREAEPPRLLRLLPRHVDHRLQAVAAGVPAIVLLLVRHAVPCTGLVAYDFCCHAARTHIKALASRLRVTSSFGNLSGW